MKKILVPTDFSKHSENALKVATQIAKKNNGSILAVHMMGLSESGLNTSGNSGGLEGLFHVKLAKKNFSDFLDKEYLKDLEIEQAVQDYKAFNLLNQLVKEKEVDMIVMGSHGTSGLTEDIFVGSNTEKMVRHSDVPVLVIKEPIDDFKMDQVVFACDFKLENAKAYKEAINLFDKFNAKVNMLYVNTPQKFKSSREIDIHIERFLNEVGGINKVEFYNDYTVENGVFNYSDDINADLIAIPTHGRRGLAHFFTGSIGEDIANHSKKPVITFKI